MSVIGIPVSAATTPTTSSDPTATTSSASQLTIINQALLMLQTAPAQSLEEATPHAQAAVALYNGARDETLRSGEWPFARRRVTPSRLAVTPLYGFAYSFQLPGDLIKLVDVSSPEMENRRGRYVWSAAPTSELYPDFVWKVESDRILSNESTLYLDYVARVVDPARYDALFVNALAANLALKLSYALTGSSSQQELLTRLYGEYLRQARSVAAGEQQQGADSYGGSYLVDSRNSWLGGYI